MSTVVNIGPCGCCGGGGDNPVICDTGCDCPDGMPTRWKVTFSGLEDGGVDPCDECSLLNGTHVFTPGVGAGEWEWYLTDPEETPRMSLYCEGGDLYLEIFICPGDSSLYSGPIVDCTGANVLTLVALAYTCNDTMPATVTVEPDGEVTGSCPVTVSCCVEPIARTLYLTVVATDTSCTGLNGAIVPITYIGYSSSQHEWAGDLILPSGMIIGFSLYCHDVDGWSVCVFVNAVPVGCTEVNDNCAEPTSVTCSPLSLEFDPWDDGNGGNLLTGGGCTCTILSMTVTE